MLGAKLRIGQANVGLDYLLPALVGAFLGSTTIKPGRVNIWGTVCGVLILAVGISGIQQLGGAFFVEPLFNGATLVISIALAAGVGPCPAQSARAPYEADMQRLAEILGALHYLRAICGANEGQTWRNEMQALIDAEAPGGQRRDRLTASFNRGYRGFQQTYRTCTPAADLAIRRYLEEAYQA